MEDRPQIFACVGPESTGKTTLCNQLAAHFGGAVVPESAREYLNAMSVLYEKSDLLTIAKNQLELENSILSTGHRPVFCDTDVLVIKVWHEFKYGDPNAEIDRLLSKQWPRNYLLTYPDLPWEPDPLRESPDKLMELFERYRSELTAMGAAYHVIKGSGERRLINAIDHISSILRRTE